MGLLSKTVWSQKKKAQKKLCDEKRRIGKTFSLLQRDGLGLEIGPSHKPIAPKRAGYNVEIVDHLSADELKKKYTGHNVNLDNIEEVDYVWSGQPLSELIGTTNKYDWIIASHVIEHIPDVISFLQECQKILKQTGYLSLIIPDKRYCFDYFQPVSTTGSFLDAYHEKRTKPSPGQVFDHFANFCKLKGQIAWSPKKKGELTLVHDLDDIKNQYNKTCQGEYVDTHCWRFTPESFRLFLSDIKALGLVDFSIAESYDTDDFEFFVTLGKAASTPTASDRIDLLNTIVSPLIPRLNK